MRLPGYGPGANISLVNTMFRRFTDDDNKRLEVLTLVYKDLDTGIKYKQEILDPIMKFYVVRPECHTNHNRLFVKKEEVIECEAPAKLVDRESAKAVGLGQWYRDCMQSGDREQARSIRMHPDIFGTDVNIEDHYRFEFSKTYLNQPFIPSKCYFDIEADTIDMAGDFPEPGECPVNAITAIFEEQKQVYTLLLRNPANPQIAEFESFMNKDRGKDLKSFIRDHMNQSKPGLYDKYGIDEFDFMVGFYDVEIELISDLFNMINTFKPDFAMAWNMAFDVPYLIARIKNLGYDPIKIICHPDFEYKCADYYIDERNRNDFAERGDFAMISSYTVYIDQLIQYASRRKGQTRPTSFGLDFIGYVVAGVRKLDYKMITPSLAQLPYVNYKIFAYYNICDTLVQKCVEQVTEDMDFIVSKSLMNNTRYSKVHRQTVYLANRGRKEFDSYGYILSNNFNRENEKPLSKFPGVICAA